MNLKQSTGEAEDAMYQNVLPPSQGAERRLRMQCTARVLSPSLREHSGG